MSLLLPSTSGMGWLRAFPSPVTAGAPGDPCWPHGDTGFTPGGIERFQVPVPGTGIHEQPLPTAGQRGAASLGKGWIYGVESEQRQETSWLHTTRKYQPPNKVKDSTFNMLNMETKGLVHLPPKQRKPQTQPDESPSVNEWIHLSSSAMEEPLSECSSWFLRSQLLFMQSIYTFSWLFMQRNYFIV